MDFLSVDQIALILTHIDDTRHLMRFMLCSHTCIDAGRQSFCREQIFNRRQLTGNVAEIRTSSGRIFNEVTREEIRFCETRIETTNSRDVTRRMEYTLTDVLLGRLWRFEWWTDNAEEDMDTDTILASRPSAVGLWMLFNADHRCGRAEWYVFSRNHRNGLLES